MNYSCGFGNHFSTESIQGALPKGQNSPQKVPYGLVAEQISGSAFTAPRSELLRSWLYRIRPSAGEGPFKIFKHDRLRSAPFLENNTSPEPFRWSPFNVPKEPTDFVTGLFTMAGNGNTSQKEGVAVHHYGINKHMKDCYFYNADGEFLIVPHDGKLLFKTEMGHLDVSVSEILVIPRGIKFQVELLDEKASGYICENYGAPFRLPYLGPIGSNGLANPRDFLIPVAAYEEKMGNFKLISKFNGVLWQTEIENSPLDVVAWHGNYAPYKYDLNLFQSVNSVSFDHPDPSIFTVLTSPSNQVGTANLDFVIFPSRWSVAEHTFRPPWFHRNIMSEYMGLIRGVYDAKTGGGFLPGGASLHNCMSGHGPDAITFEQETKRELKPQYLGGMLAFMFESRLPFYPTPFAESHAQKDYLDQWKSIKSNFHRDRI